MEVYIFNKLRKNSNKILIKSIGQTPGNISRLPPNLGKFEHNEGGWIIDKSKEKEVQRFLTTK